MNSLAGQSNNLVSERVCAEAAAWAVRLHGSARDRTLESGWRAWVAESPEHASAWELASDIWNTSHDITGALAQPPVPVRREPLTRRIAQAIVAAGVCVILLGVWGWQFWSRSSFTTKVGEQRTVSLRDGTRVELNTNTHLVMQYDKHVRRVILRSGEAYFAVAHEQRPFVVMAGSRKIIALGTSFMVHRDDQTDAPLTVTLIEGRVAVAKVEAGDALASKPLPDVTILNSGQRLKVRRDASAAIDSPAMDRATGWRRGQVIFDHTALSEAATDLNRYSTLRLSVALSAAQIPIGGIFRVGDSESFARAVADSYDLRLVRSGNELLLEPQRRGPPSPDATGPGDH